MNSLFRHEVVDAQQQHRHWGSVAALQPISMQVLTWFLVVVFGVMIAFLATAQYARKETAVGYLTPTKGTAKINVPRRGAIKTIHVREGDTVQDGAPLLTVETDQIASDGSDVNVAMIASLMAQKDTITNTIKAEEARGVSERQRLSATIKSLQSEITQLESQAKLQRERLKVAEKDVAAARELWSKQYMTAPELRRRQYMELEQKQLLSNVEQQISAKTNQLSEARFALAQLPTVIGQQVQKLKSDFSTAEQRLAEIKGRGAYVIRAPISGRISTVQATVGQWADPERLQMEIVPDDSTLQAQLFLPARAIGFIRPGQQVRILYDAFPYQHFGTYRGAVELVSQTILTSADAGGPVRLNEPAYRVTVALERPDVDVNGAKIALQPDMLLRADVLLESRSLLDWLISPLRSVRM